jgi:hypothetical protein
MTSAFLLINAELLFIEDVINKLKQAHWHAVCNSLIKIYRHVHYELWPTLIVILKVGESPSIPPSTPFPSILHDLLVDFSISLLE